MKEEFLEENELDFIYEDSVENPEEEPKNFQCDLCLRLFANKKNLLIHMRLHTGRRLVHCPKCYKGFQKRSHVTRHLAQHGEVRQCPKCFETFDLRTALRQHISEKHSTKR